MLRAESRAEFRLMGVIEMEIRDMSGAPPTGMTRRQAVKAAGAALFGLAITTGGMVSLPVRRADAYPWDSQQVTDRTMLKAAPVELREDMCSPLPDEVSFYGNPAAIKSNMKFNPELDVDTVTVGVPAGTDVSGLVVTAVYKRVGVHKEDGREVGCRITVSDMVEGSAKAIADAGTQASFSVTGVGFCSFYNHRSTIAMRRCESVRVTETFFYADTGETVSLDGCVVTLTSLDNNEVPTATGWRSADECCQLPGSVSKLYFTADSCIEPDLPKSGMRSYEHAIGPVRLAEPYDSLDICKHGFSWEVVGDSVQYRFIDTVIPAGGFNVSLVPVANEIPKRPVKEVLIYG